MVEVELNTKLQGVSPFFILESALKRRFRVPFGGMKKMVKIVLNANLRTEGLEQALEARFGPVIVVGDDVDYVQIYDDQNRSHLPIKAAIYNWFNW